MYSEHVHYVHVEGGKRGGVEERKGGAEERKERGFYLLFTKPHLPP